MNWWQTTLFIISFNWVAPLVICWIYALCGYWSGDFIHTGRCGAFVKFRLSYRMKKWHDKLWKDWAGVGLFLFMVYRDEVGPEDDASVARIVVHEGTHCWQWLWLGLLFYVTYMGHMIVIYLFQKNRHPYLDCWAERMARKRAGQLVNVPREQWIDGPNDRWPWW